MRLWYLLHRRLVKAQVSLHIRAVSPEPLLFAHMKYGSRRMVQPKIRHLAPLDGCACAFEEMSLWMTKSAIISWAGSFTVYLVTEPITNKLVFSWWEFNPSNSVKSWLIRYMEAVKKQKISHLTTKPTKWLCAQRRVRSAWASAQSDQSSLCAQWVAKDPSFLHADSEDSDQTGWMPRLIWVFAGRTCHFVDFDMRRLKWQYFTQIMNLGLKHSF